MSSGREVEYSSVSACRWEEGKILPRSDAPWERNDDDAASVSCIFSVAGSSIRISPMSRVRRNDKNSPPRWISDLHFHEQLQAPNDDNSQLLCLWQAKARECVALALSPQMSFVMGNTFEVYFGSDGNTRTILRRASKKDGGVERTAAPSHVCREQAWTSYWVCLTNNKLYAGVGDIPGQQCIAILDDSAAQKEETNDRIRFVGFGNTAVLDRQAPVPLHVRNICLTLPTLELVSTLNKLDPNNLDMVQVGVDEMDDETKVLIQEYEEECRKAKARAAKFGVAYKEPAPDAFIPWSQARRLRANPRAGFATGLDLGDPAEKAKQEARRKRFGSSSLHDSTPGETSDMAQVDTATTQDLPMEQAWDNEDLVRNQRTDPPPSLWKNPPVDADSSNQFSSTGDTDRPALVPEKIHIFSIDWAAFKQIRTNDIMAYFSIYGPSYVEWLGDLSCNVLFQDKYSAARALENLSQDIVSPVPDSVICKEDAPEPTDFGAIGWRFCKKVLRKKDNDRYGRRGTTARLLMRVATSLDVLHERPSSWPKPPPGFSTKRVLGPGSDFSSRRQKKRSRGDEHTPVFDPTVAGSEHPLMSGALSSGRAGFTVEELEKERASKRAKESEATERDNP